MLLDNIHTFLANIKFNCTSFRNGKKLPFLSCFQQFLTIPDLTLKLKVGQNVKFRGILY